MVICTQVTGTYSHIGYITTSHVMAYSGTIFGLSENPGGVSSVIIAVGVPLALA